MNKKIVIIGGVAGGMSAATRLRRLDETAQITVLEKGPFVSFANCGLPYHISGEIADRSALVLQTPERLQARFQLDVRVHTEAIKIDAANKIVHVRDAEGTYTLAYDELILSPGARPITPPIPGIQEATNIFTLRNIPDTDKILTYITEKNPQHATVIGAGFIGLEMVENLVKKGLSVTLVEKAPHVLPTVDIEMAAFIKNELVAHGVKVLVNTGAIAFEDVGKTVVLDTGEQLSTDLVIMSVGVAPENSLAVDAGIDTGIRGGILVDENYETSLKHIYAIGDAIIVKNQVSGADALISLASPANRQGRQVADIISGLPHKNKGSIGTAIVRVFNQSIASTGMTERALTLAEKSFRVVHTASNNHAGYFPGATTIILKLLFHPETGEIYGAQAVGKDGVDKRIDVLATAIKAGLTVEDLPELELTYAPPFGSAKDPVNMIGYAALNIIEGLSNSIQWYELDAEIAQGAFLLDVREPTEFARGHITGFTNIPLDILRCQMHTIPQDTNIIVSCASGQRSYLAERILKQSGYQVKNLDGAWGLYSTVVGTK